MYSAPFLSVAITSPSLEMNSALPSAPPEVGVKPRMIRSRRASMPFLGTLSGLAVVAVGPVTLNQNNISVTVTWTGSSRSTITGGSAAWVPGTKQVLLNTMIAPE
jgi:hypothetical protein